MNYIRNGFNFFIIILISNIISTDSKLAFNYPTSIALENKNIFVIEENGIYICDPNLNEKLKTIKTFSETEKISSPEKLSTVILIRTNYFLISLINYKVYFFDYKGTYAYNSDTLIKDFSPKSISLTPIEYYRGVVNYVVSYIDSDLKLKILYYKYDFYTNKTTHLSTTIEDNLKKRKCYYSSCYYDSDDYHYDFKNQGLSCVYLEDYYDYYFYDDDYWFLVCFFVANSTNYDYLEELVFTVKTTEIKKTAVYLHDYIKFNHNTITQIQAARSKSMDRALVCIATSDNQSKCYKFYLNYDKAKFYETISFNSKCSSELYGIKATYLYENQNVIFSCLLADENGGIESAIFGLNLESPKYSNKYFIGCTNIYGHSFIYSNNEYIIISDMQCNTSLSEITYKNEEIIFNTQDIINQVVEEEQEQNQNLPSYETDKEQEMLCPIQCKQCIETGTKGTDKICLDCNREKGYFPIFDINPLNCINDEMKKEKYPDYFFDIETGIYKPCYEKCQTCSEKGDGKNNNCLSCASGYIFQPDYEDTQNCVPKYKYFYYYNEYNQYSITETPNCPDNFNIKIIEKNKCIDKCYKDTTFNYTYNNHCYEKCPENTIYDDIDLICKDDPTKCILSQTSIYISNETFIKNEIEAIIENYAKEYNYTENHVSLINLGNYNLTLYKNKSCLSILSVSSTQIELDSVSSKVKSHYDIPSNKELIVGLIKNNSGFVSFEVYNPQNGVPLYIFDICKNDTYNVQKSLIGELTTNSKINFNDLQEMANQDINIIDLNDPFYNDICFHYKSKFNKDVPLEDRVLIYYPNISLCDDGCELEAVYIKNWTAKCNCFFDEGKNKLKDNAIYESQFGEIEELLSMANFNVMKCYKDIFILKYFVSSYGNFIILFLICTNIIFTVIYFTKSVFNIKKYIFSITAKYLKYLKKQNPSLNLISLNNNKEPKEPNIDYEKINQQSNPPKNLGENDKTANSDNNDDNNKNIIKNNNNIDGNSIKVFNRKRGMSMKRLSVFKNKTKFGNLNLAANKAKIADLSSMNSSSKSKINEMQKSNHNQRKNYFNLNKLNNNILDSCNKDIQNNLDMILKDDLDIDIEEYLNTDPNDMDYDEALRRDNRKFCRYYWEKIQANQILINTFYNTEYLKPLPIKLILLALQIDLYFFINGLFYNEEYIKKIFDLGDEDTLYKAFLRFTDNLFYAFLVGIIINYIIEFFFIEEKKIRVTLKREKDNLLILKYEMVQIIKDINTRYISFIIISFIILLFTWYHLYCFNNIYPHIQKEWLIFSILIIICVQILSLISSFMETIIRFLSFRFKSEKLFKLSLLLS